MDFTLSPLTVEPYGNCAAYTVPGKRNSAKVLAITGPTPNGTTVAYIFSLSDTSDEDFLKWQSMFKSSMPKGLEVVFKRVKNVMINRRRHVYDFIHSITGKCFHTSGIKAYYTPRMIEGVIDDYNGSFDIDSVEFIRVVQSSQPKTHGEQHA